MRIACIGVGKGACGQYGGQGLVKGSVNRGEVDWGGGNSAGRGIREQIQGIVTGYVRQKIKIINLKKAWARVFSRYQGGTEGKSEIRNPKLETNTNDRNSKV